MTNIYNTINKIFRFWGKVKINNGCWVWTGKKNADGYGRFQINKERMLVHRVSFGLFHGSVPNNMDVDHICNNRECVNPLHLRVCSKSDNAKNRLINKNNKTGYKGVHWHKAVGKFASVINANKKVHVLGYFIDKEEAHAAYCKASKELHGVYSNNREDDIPSGSIAAFMVPYE